MAKKANLIVISAPSGAGKTTLLTRVLPKFPQLTYSISVTSREPREGEIDGQHYFFRTKAQIEEMIENDELIEWMEVHGNIYGTPKFFINESLESGKSVWLDLDVYGKINFDKAYPDAKGILLLPPSLEVLKERLSSRATDSQDTIDLRIANASKELDFASKNGKYEYQFINEDIDVCEKEILDLLHSLID